ncbi:MAG: hypothetical protein LBD64_05750 [Odoribacteraceae bacterium]|jgi:hypothetical protein|nr:hypothetical protein [Odoribacteraceae bacterium]
MPRSGWMPKGHADFYLELVNVTGGAGRSVFEKLVTWLSRGQEEEPGMALDIPCKMPVNLFSLFINYFRNHFILLLHPK